MELYEEGLGSGIQHTCRELLGGTGMRNSNTTRTPPLVQKAARDVI